MGNWTLRVRQNSNVIWRTAESAPSRWKRKNRCALGYSAAGFTNMLRWRFAKGFAPDWMRPPPLPPHRAFRCGDGSPSPLQSWYWRAFPGMCSPALDLEPAVRLLALLLLR